MAAWPARGTRGGRGVVRRRHGAAARHHTGGCRPISFGLAGLASDLLGDESYRVPPLSDAEAARMVRGIRAVPLLFGYHGGERVDLTVVEDLLQRLARLAEDLPQAVFAELAPVLAGAAGCAVLGCRVWLEPAAAGSRTDWTARRLGLL